MKKLLVALLAGCMLFSLAACSSTSSSAPASAGGSTPASTPDSTPAGESTGGTDPAPPANGGDAITVGVLIYKYDDTYISTVRAAIEAYAAESATPIALEMLDGQGNQATQNDQLDILLQKDMDVILINAVDAGSGQGLADKCLAAGIPFIFFNREPDKTVLQQLDEDGNPGQTVGLFVGTTASEAGVMQGDILADLWESDSSIDLNGDGKLQYLVFKGEPGNPEAEARSTYSVLELAERGIESEDVNGAPLVANWMTDQAQSQMEAILGAKEGQIEAVFCNNDDMALGVIAALNSVGYNNGGKGDGNWIPVIGVDATDAGMAAVESGKMYGTVKQDGDAMGKALVAVAVSAGHGAAAPYVDGTGYTLAEDGVSIRIPYAPIS